jgi:hypothetical protein
MTCVRCMPRQDAPITRRERWGKEGVQLCLLPVHLRQPGRLQMDFAYLSFGTHVCRLGCMGCYARNVRSLAQHHRWYMYDESGFAVVLISGEAPRYKVLSPRPILLSTFIAVHHLLHIDLPRVDARLIASCPPSSLCAHPTSLSHGSEPHYDA